MAALANSNISTSLVANTLQTSSRDVGTLCTHGSINKWSKYKPVIWPYTNVDNLPLNVPRYAASDGRCGFKAINPMGYSTLISHYKSPTDCWEYQPPTGGASAPYRLGDFRGYDHDAEPFIRSIYRQGTQIYVYNYNRNGEYTFEFEKGGHQSTSIQPTDFEYAGSVSDIVNCKVCALVYQGQGLPYDTSTAPVGIYYGDVISEVDRPAVTVSFSAGYTGFYTVVFALDYQTASHTYLPLPDYDPDHYFSVQVVMTKTQPYRVNLSIQQIGFIGSSVSTPMSPISDYVEGKHLVMEERGQLQMQVTLTVQNDAAENYVIYGANQFLFFIRDTLSSVNKGYVTAVQITEINGSPFTTYTVPVGSTVTLTFNSLSGSWLIPYNLQDGEYYIGFDDSRFSTNQDPMIYYNIYIENDSN